MKNNNQIICCYRCADDSVIIDGKRLTPIEFEKLQSLYPADKVLWLIHSELKDDQILNPSFDKENYRMENLKYQERLLNKEIDW